MNFSSCHLIYQINQSVSMSSEWLRHNTTKWMEYRNKVTPSGYSYQVWQRLDCPQWLWCCWLILSSTAYHLCKLTHTDTFGLDGLSKWSVTIFFTKKDHYLTLTHPFTWAQYYTFNLKCQTELTSSGISGGIWFFLCLVLIIMWNALV